MSEEELENNLGVIASSGTYQFRQEVGKDNEDVDIIGQFGVGFYSAFMVADRITVVTRKYGEAQAYRWESDGADGYTVPLSLTVSSRASGSAWTVMRKSSRLSPTFSSVRDL